MCQWLSAQLNTLKTVTDLLGDLCTLALADLDRERDLERDLEGDFSLSVLLLLLRDDELELLPLFTEEL